MKTGIIFTSLLLLAQIFVLLRAIKKKKRQFSLYIYTDVIFLGSIIILCLRDVFALDIRLGLMVAALIVQLFCNLVASSKNKHKDLEHIKHIKKYIFFRIVKIFGFLLTALPFLIFPYYKHIAPSGPMDVQTTTITWQSTKATQLFAHTQNGTKYVTVQFWYPKDKKKKETSKKYPLVMFCHGFCMFRDSNLTLMQELASHGYIVGSIDLDYETLWSIHQDKSISFLDQRERMDLNHAKTDQAYDKVSKKWDHIRENDINNAIYYIISQSKEKESNAIFHQIDVNNIAMAGHSYGGSVSASIGRSNTKVKAVVDMDGTAWGEIIKIKKNSILDDETSYITPILMMYSEPHNKMISEFEHKYGNTYPNEVLLQHAKDGYRITVKGSDHFSFSDMHINAPIAALVSGATQTRDSKETIKIINHAILRFCDKYLKGEKVNLKRNVTY